MGKPVVYATADTHGNLPRVPPDADILIMAGDICPDFRPKARHSGGKFVDDTGDKQLEWLRDEFEPWLQELYRRGCHVVGIAGNHDFVFERKPDSVEALNLTWTYLRDEETTIGGVRIYGIPWVPGLPYWAFYADDAKLREKANLIPKGLDILVSHGPPSGAGDLIPRPTLAQQEKYGSDPNGERVGSTWLRGAILEKRPKLTVCGHIHEDRGMHRIEFGKFDSKPTVWNISAVKPGTYDLVPDPVVRLYY